MGFLTELKRRNVLRVGAVYVVVAWLIIQVVETIFPAFGLGDVAIRFTTIMLAIGLVPALIFAWVFELTPQGLRIEKRVDRSESITKQTGQRLDRMAIILLSLALAYFIFDKYYISTYQTTASVIGSSKNDEVIGSQDTDSRSTSAVTENRKDNSIAVLPFTNMSSDPEQEYFSDGISEEILNLLARIPELRVISRASAFYFKDSDLHPMEIATRLGVEHILGGSVRKSGNQVRITAQLIEVKSDNPIWSDKYDRDLKDIFATQEEIAAAVVDELKISLIESLPSVVKAEPEAYTYFLQARHLSRLGSAEGYEHSNELLNKALAISPDYVAALDALATNYINMTVSRLIPADLGYDLARESALEALSIDPEFAPALGRLGLIAMIYDNDSKSAAAHMGRALELQPDNVPILGNASLLLLNLGRLNDAITVAEYAVQRDPLNPSAQFNLGFFYYYAKRFEQAVTTLQTTLRLSPDFIGANYGLGLSLLLQDDPRSALEAMQSERNEAFRLLGTTMIRHASGQVSEADSLLAKAIDKYEKDAAYNIAYVYAFRNQQNQAFHWLEKAVQYDDFGLSDIVVEHLFSNLHDDPRWTQLLQRLGKAPEQLDAIRFDVGLERFAQQP